MGNIRAVWVAGVLCSLTFGTLTRAADSGSATSGSLITLSPQFSSVVQDLASEDFKTRNAATAKLTQSLLQLTGQLLVAEGPETQQRLADIMRCNTSFSTWLEGVALLSKQSREEALKWGLAEDHPALIAMAFSTRMNDRVTAARKLAAIDAPTARAMEARLLEDPDRAVYIAGMEGLWDQTLTQEIVDALWDRGVMGLVHQYLPPPVLSPSGPGDVTFRGQSLGAASVVRPQYQDGGAAMQVLIHAKSPLVADKLVTLLKEASANPKQFGTRPLFLAYRGFDFEGLLNAYNSREIISALHDLVVAQPPEAVPAPVAVLAPKQAVVWWSSRLAALNCLVKLTGQDPESYGIMPVPKSAKNFGVKTWADENLAVDKFNDWWSHHQVDGATAGTQSSSNEGKHE